jgi:uncharacterized protein YecT (DUF1311 family)
MRASLAVLLMIGCLIGHASRAGVDTSQAPTGAAPKGEPTQEEMDAAVDPCLKEGGGILYCQGADMLDVNRRIDANLNAAYKNLRNRLHGTPFEQRLVIAERKWIHDRDKKCRELSEEGFDNDTDRNAAHQAIAVTFLGCIQNELASRLEFLTAALSRLDKDGIEHFVLALSPGTAQWAPPLQVTIVPAVMGSFCDPGDIKIRGWYVFALRAPPRGDDGESTTKSANTDDNGYYLVGWFAVNQSTGSVHNFDITEKNVGALFRRAN